MKIHQKSTEHKDLTKTPSNKSTIPIIVLSSEEATTMARRRKTDAFPLPQLLSDADDASVSANNASTSRSLRSARARQSDDVDAPSSTKNASGSDATNIVDDGPTNTPATPTANAVATSKTAEVRGSKGSKSVSKTTNDLLTTTQDVAAESKAANKVDMPPATDGRTTGTASQGKAASKASADAAAAAAASTGGGVATASDKTPSKSGEAQPTSSKNLVSPDSNSNQVNSDAQAVVNEGTKDGILNMYDVPETKLINHSVFIRFNPDTGINTSLNINQTDIDVVKVRELQGTLCGGDHKKSNEDAMNSTTMAMFLTEIDQDKQANVSSCRN